MKTDEAQMALNLTPDTKPGPGCSCSTKKKKKKKGKRYKCAGKYCRRILYGRKMCSRCRHRKLKMENPMEYAYRMQRSNAKKRKPAHFREGIPFTLTREEYAALWAQHPDKWDEKRRSLQNTNRKRTCNWEVDRINPLKGYEPGNVRIVSKLMNIMYWWNSRDGQMEFSFTRVVDTDVSGEWKKAVPF